MALKRAIASSNVYGGDGAVVSVTVGLADELELNPHALRQALQSLSIEIDEFDRVDVDALDMDELRHAYSKFAGPERDLDPERFDYAQEG
jgi:hypothetical protein